MGVAHILKINGACLFTMAKAMDENASGCIRSAASYRGSLCRSVCPVYLFIIFTLESSKIFKGSPIFTECLMQNKSKNRQKANLRMLCWSHEITLHLSIRVVDCSLPRAPLDKELWCWHAPGKQSLYRLWAAAQLVHTLALIYLDPDSLWEFWH